MNDKLRVLLCILLVLFCLFCIRLLLRLLKKRSVGKSLKRLLLRFFAMLGRVYESLVSLLPNSKPTRAQQIHGYTDELLFHGIDDALPDRRSRLRWRACKTDSERIRYLYVKQLRRSIKKGFAFRYADTPAQLRQRLPREAGENPVFSLYYPARYQADNGIGAREVEQVRQFTERGKGEAEPKE